MGFKGTVDENSSDPPFKEWLQIRFPNAQFKP